MKLGILCTAAAVALSLSPTALPGAAPALPVAAPSWTLKDVDGKTVSWAQFKGKVVILDFWATWCPPCKTEIPGYIALQKKYAADGLVVVGISMDTDGTAPVKKFMKEIGINYLVVMGNDDVAGEFAPIDGYPTTFIIDRDGLIRNKKLGREPAAEFEKDILKVLKPRAS